MVTVVPYTVYGLYKPLPEGISYEGQVHHVENVEFLTDLTYEKDGEVIRNHQIFDRVIEMIEEAQEFIVFDMFLFNDLEEYGNENLQIKWYNTNDEQYHSKLILIEREEISTIIGGSANFTRRNLDDFNLDTSLKIDGNNHTKIVEDVSHYFNSLWENEGAHYTVSVCDYLENFSEYKKYLFRLQKKTGLTTF